MSTAVHITWHAAQINFGDLPPYLTYNLWVGLCHQPRKPSVRGEGAPYSTLSPSQVYFQWSTSDFVWVSANWGWKGGGAVPGGLCVCKCVSVELNIFLALWMGLYIATNHEIKTSCNAGIPTPWSCCPMAPCGTPAITGRRQSHDGSSYCHSHSKFLF